MSIFAGKRVLVTGGNGFLGSRIVSNLKSHHAFVTSPSSKEYDLVSIDQSWKLFDKCNPDFVIHCAAVVGGIGANRKSPATFFYKNLQMGLNVIEMTRLFKTGKIVVVGTICSYPKMCPIPFKESDLWNGFPEETNAPYGIAKKALLTMLQAYRQEYGLHGIYLMPVNMYGPKDNFDPATSHVIPSIIKKILEAMRDSRNTVHLWGTGKPTREFLYVDDAAEAILLALEKYDSSEPMNIGTGIEISIHDLAKKVAANLCYKGKFVWDSNMPDGQPRRCLDVSHAEKMLGWKAKTSFDEGLQVTVDWYLHAVETEKR